MSLISTPTPPCSGLCSWAWSCLSPAAKAVLAKVKAREARRACVFMRILSVWVMRVGKRSKCLGVLVVHQRFGGLASEQPEHRRREEGVEQRRADETRENHHSHRVQHLGAR